MTRLHIRSESKSGSITKSQTVHIFQFVSSSKKGCKILRWKVEKHWSYKSFWEWELFNAKWKEGKNTIYLLWSTILHSKVYFTKLQFMELNFLALPTCPFCKEYLSQFIWAYMQLRILYPVPTYRFGSEILNNL